MTEQPKKRRSPRLLKTPPSEEKQEQAPQVLPPHVEAQEAPQAEAPQAEAPQAEAPQAEAPQAEAPAEPRAPQLDPDMLLALGDATGAIERSLFLASSRIFEGEPQKHIFYAARLVSMVTLAASQELMGDHSGLLNLAKHVRSAGVASQIPGTPEKWELMSLCAQVAAFTAANVSTGFAKHIVVTPPSG